MSLAVVVKGPDGLVVAADSRVTLEAKKGDGQPMLVNFDNMTKILTFSEPHNHMAAVTYGAAVVGLRTAHSFAPELELFLRSKSTGSKSKKQKRQSVAKYASLLSEFFLAQWKKSMPDDYRGQDMVFIVVGYDVAEPYGTAYQFEIPRNPEPRPNEHLPDGFGMTWGGQLNVASRIVHGFDPATVPLLEKELGLTAEQKEQVAKRLMESLIFPIPYQVLPLQDCVNLATFLIRSTMAAQNLAVGVRGVGGPIDVATITREDGVSWLQRKELTAAIE